MSWSFSRVLVEEFLEDNSLDTVPSAPLSTTPMPPDQYYWPDKPTEHSRLSRFGMTCEPLMEGRGAELLTWFLEGSRAKTYPLQDVEMDWTVNVVDSGGRWRESLARYDQDSHSLKTAQLSLIEDWTGCSVILPRSGLMLDGQCWELPMLGRTTRETESGFLPTPVAMDAGSGRFNTSTSSGSKPRPTLAMMARKNLWPTPQASDNKDRGNLSTPAIARRVEIGKQVSLSMCVSSENGRLNPEWVEWLMGWPIGHTDLKPLETAKSHSVELRHGDCLEAVE